MVLRKGLRDLTRCPDKHFFLSFTTGGNLRISATSKHCQGDVYLSPLSWRTRQSLSDLCWAKKVRRSYDWMRLKSRVFSARPYLIPVLVIKTYFSSSMRTSLSPPNRFNMNTQRSAGRHADRPGVWYSGVWQDLFSNWTLHLTFFRSPSMHMYLFCSLTISMLFKVFSWESILIMAKFCRR